MSTTLQQARQIAGRVARLQPDHIAKVCSPRHVQSVLEDLQRDVATLCTHIERLHLVAHRVSTLNPQHAGIGAGMLATLVAEAQTAIEPEASCKNS
jgi:hypothetical protein